MADDGKFAPREGSAHGYERELDRRARITIPRNVGEVNASPVRACHLCEQFAGGLVRKVTMASADALFQRPGAARVRFEELGAMIRFDDDDLAASQVLADVLRGVSEIGEEGKRMTRREKIVVVS